MRKKVDRDGRARADTGGLGRFAPGVAGAVAGAVASAIIASLAVPSGGAVARGERPAPAELGEPGADIRHVSDQIAKGKPIPLRHPDAKISALLPEREPAPRAGSRRAQPESAGAGAPDQSTPRPGDRRVWLALDYAKGEYYLKEFTLRGVGDHIEIWAATGEDEISAGLDFPAGDCRNGPRTTVTDEQIQRFVAEFDDTIYPIESRVFSRPPDRGGADATLDEQIDVPEDYWAGPGERIVTLVDNVRDANFYDTDNQRQLTYIAGFFTAQFGTWFDRNVMTVDGWDWIHRTGPNPPDEPSEDPCTTAPARPNLYEGTFAHEYQHLLHSYTDPDETAWINEGLSDYAQTLVGYADTTRTVSEHGHDSHIQCFLGWLAVKTPANPNPRPACGPENSLTAWEDQGEGEILADYGAAYSFVTYLADHFGERAVTDLHRRDTNGLASVQEALAVLAPGMRASDVLHAWAAATALDGVLDEGARLRGGWAGTYSSRRLHSTIHWDTPHAYDTPGAPPNGSDYVRVRDGEGRYLPARSLRSLAFEGARTLAPRPVEWAVDADARQDDPALHSGTGDDLDRAIVVRVAVPDDEPTLTFDTKWDTEEGWDFAFVQVSTDGGRTYESLAGPDTTDEHDPGALESIVANLPGFTGSSGAWRQETFDLTPYRGQEVLLAFRLMTDPGVHGTGFWVDNVRVGGRVGGTVVSDGSSLAGLRTPTQIRPVEVAGWSVQLVGHTEDLRRAYLAQVPLDGGFAATLTRGRVRALLGDADVVAVIVTQDDPSESVSQQARYTLTVNGVGQPGG